MIVSKHFPIITYIIKQTYEFFLNGRKVFKIFFVFDAGGRGNGEKKKNPSLGSGGFFSGRGIFCGKGFLERRGILSGEEFSAGGSLLKEAREVTAISVGVAPGCCDARLRRHKSRRHTVTVTHGCGVIQLRRRTASALYGHRAGRLVAGRSAEGSVADCAATNRRNSVRAVS